MRKFNFKVSFKIQFSDHQWNCPIFFLNYRANFKSVDKLFKISRLKCNWKIKWNMNVSPRIVNWSIKIVICMWVCQNFNFFENFNFNFVIFPVIKLLLRIYVKLFLKKKQFHKYNKRFDYSYKNLFYYNFQRFPT